MTKHRAKPSVWDRSKQDPLPETARAKEMRVLQSKKLLTVSETCRYLRVDRSVVDRMIQRGVIEVVDGGARTRLVSMECLRGLLMPVRPLNKRLQYLEAIKVEVENKIKNLKKE